MSIVALQDDRFVQIAAERDRQDAKWGEQNHHPLEWLSILGEEIGEACQAANEAHFGRGMWSSYRQELVEAAAVIVAALSSLERNGPPEAKH